MGRFERGIGAASIALWPLCFGVADGLRLIAIGDGDQVGDGGVSRQQQAVAETGSVAAHLVLFQVVSWLFLAAALLTVPAALSIWSLSVGRSRAWAWTGVVMAMLGVVGQLVHVVVEFGLQQAYASGFDATAGFTLDQLLQHQVFVSVMFAPFFLVVLAPIVQAIGLRRARVTPIWAVGVVVIGSAVAVGVGSVNWSSAVVAVLWVAGTTPAALVLVRGNRGGSDARPIGSVSAAASTGGPRVDRPTPR